MPSPWVRRMYLEEQRKEARMEISDIRVGQRVRSTESGERGTITATFPTERKFRVWWERHNFSTEYNYSLANRFTKEDA